MKYGSLSETVLCIAACRPAGGSNTHNRCPNQTIQCIYHYKHIHMYVTLVNEIPRIADSCTLCFISLEVENITQSIVVSQYKFTLHVSLGNDISFKMLGSLIVCLNNEIRVNNYEREVVCKRLTLNYLLNGTDVIFNRYKLSFSNIKTIGKTMLCAILYLFL